MRVVVVVVSVVVVVAGGARGVVKDVMDFDDKVGDASWDGVVGGHGDGTAGVRHFDHVCRKSAARSAVLTGRDLL